MEKTDTALPPVQKPGPTVKERLGEFFADLYKVHLFVLRFFKEAFLPPFEFKEIGRQCFEVGVRSFTLITVTGFIVALIAAGKVGSSIGAELGSMRVTEQIDAMEVSGTKPFKYLVCTRVIATTIAIPILATYTAFIALLGGFINVNMNEGTSYSAFMEQVFEPLTFIDFWASLIKSIVFGFTIGIVGCYQGYYSTKGTEGVGKAANGAVVTAMFLVFIEEVVIVQITGWFR
jgi:phospholipid/cholesterol/gamma-HCH transport system permease protein